MLISPPRHKQDTEAQEARSLTKVTIQEVVMLHLSPCWHLCCNASQEKRGISPPSRGFSPCNGMAAGKGDFPRGVYPPVAAATASGLFSVSPWPLASAGKQKRGEGFFWLDSGRQPVGPAQHACAFPPLSPQPSSPWPGAVPGLPGAAPASSGPPPSWARPGSGHL